MLTGNDFAIFGLSKSVTVAQARRVEVFEAWRAHQDFIAARLAGDWVRGEIPVSELATALAR